MMSGRGFLMLLIAAGGLHANAASGLVEASSGSGIQVPEWTDMFVAPMSIAWLATCAMVLEQWLKSPSFVLSVLAVRPWRISSLPFARVWNLLQAHNEVVALMDRWCREDSGNRLALNAYMDGIFAGLDIRWPGVTTVAEASITLPMNSRWSLRDLHRMREIGRQTGVAIRRREGAR